MTARDEEITLTWYELGAPLLDPHPAPCDAGAAIRRVHRADPGERRAPRPQRLRGRRPALAARARGQAVQHLRPGVLRELDRDRLSRCRPRRAAASGWSARPGLMVAPAGRSRRPSPGGCARSNREPIDEGHLFRLPAVPPRALPGRSRDHRAGPPDQRRQPVARRDHRAAGRRRVRDERSYPDGRSAPEGLSEPASAIVFLGTAPPATSTSPPPSDWASGCAPMAAMAIRAWPSMPWR